MRRSGGEVEWRDCRCRSRFHCWVFAVVADGFGSGSNCDYNGGLEMKAWLEDYSVEMEDFLLFLFESPIGDDAFAQSLGRALVEDFALGHAHRQLCRA